MKTLVLASSPGVALATVTKLVGQQSDATVVTNSGSLTRQTLQSSTYDLVLSVSEVPGFHTSTILGNIGAWMRPGASLVLHEQALPDTEAKLLKGLLLSGFVGAEPSQAVDFDGSSYNVVKATKPSWETGARAAISLKPAAKKPASGPAVSLSLADVADDDLIDEEELLSEEDRARPVVPGLDECGNIGKKACANCTCGRADADAPPVQLTQEMLENPQSGCGSCSLGDAFRCAGCPYKGLPKFEMGKKIQLPDNFLLADL